MPFFFAPLPFVSEAAAASLAPVALPLPFFVSSLVFHERLGTERVRELVERALLLLLVSQFLLGRIRGRFHARRAFRFEGFGTLGLPAVSEQRGRCSSPKSGS